MKLTVLQTLIGNCITDYERQKNFKDIPTSLHRLDKFITANPSIPIIHNPVLENEGFNRNWEEINYQNFRQHIHSLKQRIDDAIYELKTKVSMEKWWALLGPPFGK